MISLNEIRSRALAFSKEWDRDYSEDAEAKSFWDGFFDVFGVSRRRVASFEYPVKKLAGDQGFIDVLWKGTLLAEHKSRGKNLDKAYTQAKDYFPGLKDGELPRYVIVSDFARVRLHDLEQGTDSEFKLADLHKNVHLFDFISGRISVVDYGIEEEASVEAAELMADFHNEIAKTGYTGHDLEVFLIRTLFCLFADDTGIFPKNHFRAYIENHTQIDGSDLGIKILQVFHTLNKPREQRQNNLDEELNIFPYVNGAIFSESIAPLALDATARLKLIKCCAFDWSNISASIFGSLFQGVMDERSRRELGAHYTSEKNILKVIQPLFLDELYIEFDQVKFLPKKLEDFHNKLSKLKFLDPACGCGNFLVVAYRELRKLELQVLELRRKNDQKMLLGTEDLSKLNVNQFYGIEIEEFPSLVARVAMYLVDHQMNNLLSQSFGEVYARIPLREPATIVNADALNVDWNDVVSKDTLTYILGNPPFIGARLMTKIQKDLMLKLFPNLKGAGNLDFVSAWYLKAASYIQDTQIKVAFVSTNSIVQGEQVGILWRCLKEKYSISINFAHQTFKWNNDAPGVAAVYCVIVGFSAHEIESKYLFEYETLKSEPREKEVKHINGYLVAGRDVFLDARSKPLQPETPLIKFGNQPNDNGALLLTAEERRELIAGEPLADKWIRPFISASEFLNGEDRFCLWLEGIEPQELKAMPMVLQRVERVIKHRLQSTRKATQELAAYPTLFGFVSHQEKEYILIPRHSSENRKYVPMAFLSPESIAADSCLAVYGASLYEYGILQSLIHMTWMSYVCGRLKSDYRYSNSLVYNNFPWPQNVPDNKKALVESCAKEVLSARERHPGASLSDLYNPFTIPPELTKAHNDLDSAVDACYGRKFQSPEERIEFLFDLYLTLR
jgi:hypothetical protein